MDKDANSKPTPQCLVLVFPDINVLSDARLALHDLREGEYRVQYRGQVVNIRVPELSQSEILSMDIYIEREMAGDPVYQIPQGKDEDG